MELNPYLLCQLHAQEPCPDTSFLCYSSRVGKMKAEWFQFGATLAWGELVKTGRVKGKKRRNGSHVARSQKYLGVVDT